MTLQFKIGATAGTVALLSSLGVLDPAREFSLYSDEVTLPDGSIKGLGWTQASWHWGFITKAQYDILKTYCPGKSASIAIQTLDETQAWDVFTGKIIWPSRISVSNSKVIDFTLVFNALVEAP